MYYNSVHIINLPAVSLVFVSKVVISPMLINRKYKTIM